MCIGSSLSNLYRWYIIQSLVAPYSEHYWFNISSKLGRFSLIQSLLALPYPISIDSTSSNLYWFSLIQSLLVISHPISIRSTSTSLVPKGHTSPRFWFVHHELKKKKKTERKKVPCWRRWGLFNTLPHLSFQLRGFRMLLRLQEVQRLVLQREDVRRSLQLHALHWDGLDQIQLSWPAEVEIGFIPWSEVGKKKPRKKQDAWTYRQRNMRLRNLVT